MSNISSPSAFQYKQEILMNVPQIYGKEANYFLNRLKFDPLCPRSGASKELSIVYSD
jgi:hypothetical protein